MSTKPTLLLIDDEERIVRSLSLLFRQKYNVIATTDPQVAIETCRTQPVHVVISDQRMPTMQGVEVLRQVKEVSPDTMRLLLTGYSDLNAIIGSINEGEIFRFINKPWNQTDLLETVATAADIAQAARLSDKPEASAPAKRATCVVIDEDPETRALVEEAIGDRADVLYHTNLESALETMSEVDTSLLLTDIRLGDQDISSVIHSLRQQNPQLVTIVLTSFQDTAKLIELINHGQVFRFLPKPARRGLLSQCFDSALKRHDTLSKFPELLQRQQPASEKTPSSLSDKFMVMLNKIQRRQQGVTSQ